MVMVPYLAKAPGGDANSVGSDEPPHDFLFSRVVPTWPLGLKYFIFNDLLILNEPIGQQQGLSWVRQKATVDVARWSLVAMKKAAPKGG